MRVQTTQQEMAIERRRQLVASMLARKPNISQRQIRIALAANGVVNPETSEPYSLGTVNEDIKAIRQDWRVRRQQDADTWLDLELAKLNELEEAAWGKGQYEIVLRAMERRDRYLGLSQRAFVLGGDDAVVIALVKANVDAL